MYPTPLLLLLRHLHARSLEAAYVGAGGDLAEQHRVSQGRQLHRREAAGSLVPYGLDAGQEGHEPGVARGFAHVVVRTARRGLLFREGVGP